MIKKLGMGLVASVAALVVLYPADAAIVTRVSGEVLINDGNGFVSIATAAELAPGGQLMVRPGGVAVVSYESNCVIRVGAGRVWVVQEKPPCADGNEAIDFTGRMNGGSLKDDPIVEQRFDPTPLIIGGLGAGGVAAIILTHDNPSSP